MAVATSRVREIGVAIGVALAGFAVGSVVGLVLAVLLVSAGVEITDTLAIFLSLVSLQGIGFPAVALAYLRARNLPLSFVPTSVPSLREVGVAVGGYLLTFLLVNLAALVVTALDAETADNEAAQTALENPEIIPYLIPLVFLLNAPGEELLFRGIIQGSLREVFSPATAIVLASATFAPLHVLALIGSLQAVLTTIALLFLPSLVFGAVYEYTDNIVVPSLTHALYNATLFALLYYATTASAPSVL